MGGDRTFWPRFVAMVLPLPGFGPSKYLFQRILKGSPCPNCAILGHTPFLHSLWESRIGLSFCCGYCHHAFWHFDTIYLMVFDTIYLMIFETIYIMIFCTNCVISVSQSHLVPYVKSIEKPNKWTPQHHQNIMWVTTLRLRSLTKSLLKGQGIIIERSGYLIMEIEGHHCFDLTDLRRFPSLTKI